MINALQQVIVFGIGYNAVGIVDVACAKRAGRYCLPVNFKARNYSGNCKINQFGFILGIANISNKTKSPLV